MGRVPRPSAAASGPAGLSTSQRVNAERLAVFGWSRAILLQLAHPLVAAGVAEHSTFRRGGLTAVRRLHHTVRAMLALTFGDEAEREAALDGIRTIHRRVHGRLRDAVGVFPAGAAYSAEDPDLVLWVHVTLLESIPLVYELLVAPLTTAERDAYCLEAAPIAAALGARRADIPVAWAAVGAYVNRMYSSRVIAVSHDARELAAAVLRPPFAALVGPAARTNRLLTVGLLSSDLRRQYGLAWSEADDRSLVRVVSTLRRLRRLAPVAAALWPEARRVS